MSIYSNGYGMAKARGGNMTPPLVPFQPQNANFGRPPELGNLRGRRPLSANGYGPLDSTSGPLYSSQELMNSYPELQGTTQGRIDPATGARVPSSFGQNKITGPDIFRQQAFQEANEAQGVANEQWGLQNQIIDELTGAVRGNIAAVGNVGQEYPGMITESANANYADLVRRTNEQVAGYENFIGAQTQASSQALQNQYEQQKQQLTGAQFDGTSLPGEIENAKRERLERSRAESVGNIAANASVQYNNTLASIKGQGYQTLQRAGEMRTQAIGLASSVSQNASQIANEMALRGYGMISQMVGANPRPNVSRLAVLSYLHELNSAPGAEGSTSRAAGIPYTPYGGGLKDLGGSRRPYSQIPTGQYVGNA